MYDNFLTKGPWSIMERDLLDRAAGPSMTTRRSKQMNEMTITVCTCAMSGLGNIFSVARGM